MHSAEQKQILVLITRIFGPRFFRVAISERVAVFSKSELVSELEYFTSAHTPESIAI